MEKRVSDREAEALLSGQTPVGRPELEDLATRMSDLRSVSRSVSAPLSSTAFQARLDERLVASLSMNDDAMSASSSLAEAAPISVGKPSAFTQGVRKMMAWLAGLGLASKIALGTGVVVVAASGVGAAGALPGPAQTAFDTIVSTVTGNEEEIDDDPARVDDDESDVDDDPIRVDDDDESEVDDDSDGNDDDDEAEVDDDGERVDDDESDVNDDPERTDDDESDVNDDPATESDDESDEDDDPATEIDEESDEDDDPAPTDED